MTHVCLAGLERAARDVLLGEIWDFLAGGSDTEASLAANRSAIERIFVIPRITPAVPSIQVPAESWCPTTEAVSWTVPYRESRCWARGPPQLSPRRCHFRESRCCREIAA